MPGLVTCRGTSLETHWNVASDDWVLPALFYVPLSLFCSILVVAALVGYYISPGCPPDGEGLPPLLYSSMLALLLIEVFTAMDETAIAAISYRGTIWNTKKRDAEIPKYIYVRFILLLLEFAAIISSFVATFEPSYTQALDCSTGYIVATALARTATIIVLLKFIFSTIRLLLVLDPCGLLTPGLLQHFSFLDSADDHGEMPESLRSSRVLQFFTKWSIAQRGSQGGGAQGGEPLPSSPAPTAPTPHVRMVKMWQRQGSRTLLFRPAVPTANDLRSVPTTITESQNQFDLRQIQRRVQVVFCCLGVCGNRARGVAIDNVAGALYTLFDFDDDTDGEGGGGGGGSEGGGDKGEGVRMIMSDAVAAFKLVNEYQQEAIKSLGEDEQLEDHFRKVTFDAMSESQKPDYQYLPPRQFSYDNTESYLLIDNLIHYMRYSAAMYSWPLHVFAHPACGICQLSSRTCCRCLCRRSMEYEYEREVERQDCCMCDVAILTLLTGVAQNDIYYLSLDDQVFQTPFAVVYDKKTASIVIAIRGTLSFKDLLTDMSYSLIHLHVDGVKESFVHQGLYASAVEIYNKLLGKTREEIRAMAVEQGQCLNELQLDEMVKKERQDKMLTCILERNKDYQLVVTGHSLGAGVASVLALLLRRDFPDLHCYAFSPPGATFSYPLAKYSREFTTTVVLGNDIVPRFNFRSLVYLKEQAKNLLKNCQRPKFDVLFRPKSCSNKNTAPNLTTTESQNSQDQQGSSRQRAELRRKLTSDELENFARTIVGEGTTSKSLQNTVFPVKHIPPRRSLTRDVLSRFKEDIVDDDNMKSPCGTFTPTFPPGNVFHIRIEKTSSQCCSGWTRLHRRNLEIYKVSNEDMCMIQMELGALEHHLPNNVLDALEDFKSQSVAFGDSTYQESEVEKMREEAKRERHQKRVAKEVDLKQKKEENKNLTSPLADHQSPSSLSLPQTVELVPSLSTKPLSSTHTARSTRLTRERGHHGNQDHLVTTEEEVVVEAKEVKEEEEEEEEEEVEIEEINLPQPNSLQQSRTVV